MRGFVEAVGSNTFAELIKEEAVKSAPPFARRQAAVRWSEPGERYKDAWMLAEFGDAVAVNGKLLSDDDVLPDRDKGYVMVTDPDDTVTSEEQITLETLAQTVAERLGVPNMRDEVLASLQMSEGFQHGVFAKVLGRTEVWLPKDQAEDERSRAVIPYRDDE